MEHIAVRKAKDLQADAKRWVESLFGRPLQEEEEVTVFVLPSRSVVPESVRSEASVRLNRILDKAAENMKDVPDAEFEAAMEEAMEHVRRRGA